MMNSQANAMNQHQQNQLHTASCSKKGTNILQVASETATTRQQQHQLQATATRGHHNCRAPQQHLEASIKMASPLASGEASSQTQKRLVGFFIVYTILMVALCAAYAAYYFLQQHHHQLKQHHTNSQHHEASDEPPAGYRLAETSRLVYSTTNAGDEQQQSASRRLDELETKLESKLRRLERYVEIISADLQETKNRLREREKCDCSRSCTFNGTRYADQSSWKHQCDTCTCKSGQISCVPQKCPRTNCDDAVQLPGQCCPTCMKKCKYNSTLIRHGQKFAPLDSRGKGQSRTKECRCHDGLIKCESISRQQQAAAAGTKRSALSAAAERGNATKDDAALARVSDGASTVPSPPDQATEAAATLVKDEQSQMTSARGSGDSHTGTGAQKQQHQQAAEAVAAAAAAESLLRVQQGDDGQENATPPPPPLPPKLALPPFERG